MKKNLRKTVFFALVTIATLSPAGQPVHAQEAEEPKTLIEKILEEIEELSMLVNQRLEFGAVEPAEVEESVSQYFFLREAGASESRVFGDEPSTIILETDGGAKQILIQQECSKKGFVTYAGQKGDDCVADNWIIASEGEGGVTAFEIEVSYVSAPTKDTVLDISVCRFNGCANEGEVVVTYKEEKEFLDYVQISDRYSYEYEYDDEEFHIQEFLIDFGGQEVNGVRVVIQCGGNDFGREKSAEKQRIGCNENKRISRSIIDYGQVDDQGNTFDLMLQFIANVTEQKAEGTLPVELRFTDMKNRVHETTYDLHISSG